MKKPIPSMFLLMSMLLVSSGFCADMTNIYDNSTSHNFDLLSPVTLIFNAYNNTDLVSSANALSIICPLLTDSVFPANFTSNASLTYPMEYSITEFPNQNFTCIIRSVTNTNFNETFTFYINDITISTGLIDEVISASVNIVYQGFLITSGILSYLQVNYVIAIAGLIVLGLLLALIMGVSGSGSLSSIKDLFK